MARTSALLAISFGWIFAVQACQSKSPGVQIDQNAKKKTDQNLPSSDFPSDSNPSGNSNESSDSTADVTVEVAIRVSDKKAIDTIVANARNILMPIFADLQANKMPEAQDVSTSLINLDIFAGNQIEVKRQDLCKSIVVVNSKLKSSSGPAENRNAWLKSLATLAAKGAICE